MALAVPSFVETYVQQLSDAIGFDVETLNYTLGLFLCYPLGMIMNMIPYGFMRHAFSFLLGAFLLQFTLGVQWIHQLITSVVAYAMFLLLPRKTCTYLVPLFVMMYCVLGHLHRQYINYLGWDLDFTGCQMVLTQKLYMMAYNLYDGECLAKGKDNRASKKCASFALKELPGFIEYLGYTFCFASVLSGPAFEYTTYCGACDGSLMYDKNGKPKGKIPSNVWPTLRPFLVSLLNLVIFVVVGGSFPLLDPEDPKGNTPVILTTEFLAKPWVYRYLYMWVGLLCVRQKYYFAWMNAEGANNVWYAGFEGFDEKGEAKGWENSSNADIWAFETAPNVQTLSKEWNKKTSLWLTKYVYIRTNGSLLAVYAMSAFWHGCKCDFAKENCHFIGVYEIFLIFFTLMMVFYYCSLPWLLLVLFVGAFAHVLRALGQKEDFPSFLQCQVVLVRHQWYSVDVVFGRIPSIGLCLVGPGPFFGDVEVALLLWPHLPPHCLSAADTDSFSSQEGKESLIYLNKRMKYLLSWH